MKILRELVKSISDKYNTWTFRLLIAFLSVQLLVAYTDPKPMIELLEAWGYHRAIFVSSLLALGLVEWSYIITRLIVNGAKHIEYILAIYSLLNQLNEEASVTRKMDVPGDVRARWANEDIALIRVENGIAFMYNSNQCKSHWLYPLQDTMGMLQPEYFLVNRGAIVCAGNIKKICRTTSRRYCLTLKSPEGIQVNVSQGKMKEFEAWMVVNKLEAV